MYSNIYFLSVMIGGDVRMGVSSYVNDIHRLAVILVEKLFTLLPSMGQNALRRYDWATRMLESGGSAALPRDRQS